MVQIKLNGKFCQVVRLRLLKCKDYERKINKIRASIMNPRKELDENIGEGRFSVKNFVVENKG